MCQPKQLDSCIHCTAQMCVQLVKKLLFVLLKYSLRVFLYVHLVLGEKRLTVVPSEAVQPQMRTSSKSVALFSAGFSALIAIPTSGVLAERSTCEPL